jgi:hypothetical protein
VVHAGIGIGTLACALACNGMRVLGVERYAARIDLAHLLREAVAQIWPEVRDRYEIVGGTYPEAVIDLPWQGQDTLLLFTNVAAGWTEQDLRATIASMTRYGQVFLDLRLFGSVRETDQERAELFDRIRATAREAEHLPDVARGVHLARFAFA